MGFLLRIYFVGLVAFVPDPSGQKMTVLLVDARQPYVASDGEMLPVHHPLLMVRADRCDGDCATQQGAVADVVYASASSPAERGDKLHRALAGGGSWVLDQSELRIVLPEGGRGAAAPFHIVRGASAAKRGTGASPAAAADPADFDQVADLSAILGRNVVVDPTLLEMPDKGRTVALMRLAAGTVKAQRLSGFTDEVVGFQFATARELEAGVDLGMPTQALADRVMVEIPVAGCSVRLEDKNAATGARRAMDLAPASCNGGLVEVAVINLPEHGFEGGVEHGEAHDAAAPVIDHHFELFYDLAEFPPPRNRRPVPGYVYGPRTPRPPGPADSDSAFLALLGLAPNRSLWSGPQCPVARLFAR
ncbi:MAG TPA: hypothetical protein VN923_19485 [Thermoanaerobaculia bacterium]|nr:hypothetical protein [Thermoanaerobaculia bacterium]